MLFSGIWQLRHLSLSLKENLLTSQGAKVHVDDTAFVEASSFSCCGTWKIKSALQLTLRGSASFSAAAKLSAVLFKLIAEGHCTVAGHISVDNLIAYVRNDMITSPTGKVTVQISATIAAGIYRNDGTWNAEGNIHMHIACFEQSEDAIIYVKDTLSMVLYDFSEERSQGRIVANYFIMKSKRRTRFDGYIRVNQIEISAPYMNESSCTIGGQLEVLNGPLLLKGYSENNVNEKYFPHSFAGFILEGQLKAEAVIAPFLALTFSETSYSLLSGMESVTEAPFRTLISCASLKTKPTSLIDSISEDQHAEAILCSTNWIHEGQIKFHGDAVHIVANCFLNRGRLTSDTKLQNHMHDVIMFIGSGFQNEAVFSADRITIIGNGELINKNRVYASECMDIHLPNYCIEGEQLLCDRSNTKVLSSNNRYGKINGIIEAKSRLEPANPRILNKLNWDKQLYVTARSELVITNNIIDSAKNFSLSARDAIIFESMISVDQLELRVGTAYASEIVISKNASVKAQQFRVSGSCKFLTLLIDGELSCKTLLLDVAVRRMKLIGKGAFYCKSSCNITGNTVIVAIAEMCVAELIGSEVTFDPNKAITLSPPDNKETVTIYADSCQLHGEVLLEHKIILKVHNGVANIDGQIMGTCADSEMCIESSDAIISGTLANLDFFECYARKRIEFSEIALIKNLNNIAMESSYILLNGKLINCSTLIATADEIDIQGEINPQMDSCAYSFYGEKINFNGEILNLARLELNAPRINIHGNFTDVTLIEIDTKMINFSPKSASCTHLTITSYSCIFAGFIQIQHLELWSQMAIVIHVNFNNAQSCTVISPVIFALNNLFDDQNIHLSALLYISDKSRTGNDNSYNGNVISAADIIKQEESTAFSEKTLIKILFTPDTVNTIADHSTLVKTLKKFAKIFQAQTITHDDLIDALEVTSQLSTVHITISVNSSQYEQLYYFITEFEQTTPCDLSKLFAIFCDSKTVLSQKLCISSPTKNTRSLFFFLLQ